MLYSYIYTLTLFLLESYWNVICEKIFANVLIDLTVLRRDIQILQIIHEIRRRKEKHNVDPFSVHEIYEIALDSCRLKQVWPWFSGPTPWM